MTCGGCDISCKYAMDMEVLKPIFETRIRCIESGYTIPVLDRIINRLRKQGTMVAEAKIRCGDWSKGLDVRDTTMQKTDIIFHAGCRTSYDRDMWKVARTTIETLHKAGVDIGVAGENESCCGGRAYQMGYREDAIKQAKRNVELFKKLGVRTLVTDCADCYQAFKVLYDEFGLKGDLKVLHTTEYLNLLIKESRLKPTRTLNMNVTYHDPCHLGRLGEPYIHWQGEQVSGHIRIFNPPKEFRRGTYGIYEPPRDVLKSIPDINLVEMARIKEYTWCCGAGGGVTETSPELARFAAGERIKEAESTGAEAIVTACPGCEKSFSEAIKDIGSTLQVYDVVELVYKSTS